MALDRKALAIGMLAGSGVMLVIAGITVWNGVGRFFAAGALEDHAAAVFDGDVVAARRAAERAASWLGSDARAALPAIDIADPESDRRLEILTHQVPATQRHLVITARNFGRAVRGEEPTQAEAMLGSDAGLVEQLFELAALDRPKIPELPAADRFLPPSREILHRTLEDRLRTAWRLGDSRTVRDSAAALRLLDPDHPAALQLEVVDSTLDAATDVSQITMDTNKLPGDDRADLLRGLIALIDRDGGALGNVDRERRVARLLNLIPAGERTPEEMRRWLSSGDRDLAAAAQAAKRDGSPAVVIAAFNRAFERERYDLAADLVGSLPAALQTPARLAVAEYTWDVETLQSLAEDPQRHLPTIVGAHLAFDHVAFHVSSPSGAVPRRQVFVRIDGRPIHANDIRRFGSLVQAPITPGSGAIRLEVLLDERVIHSGEVRK